MKLPFGRAELTFDLPADRPVAPLVVDAAAAHAAGARWPALDDAATALGRDAPCAPGARVLVLVPDRTRAFPLDRALPRVLAGLRARGIAAADITVFLASGTHGRAPADDAPARLGALPAGVRVTRNDPDAAGVLVGTTPRGTPVRVAPELLAADVVLALGGTAFHYFAGFGGGPKMLFPGAGARGAIAGNHARALGPWPPGGLAEGVGPGHVDDNPVALDLRDAARLLPTAHHVTGFEDGAGAWRGARWSQPEEFAAVCASYAAGRRIGPARAFTLLAASAGGAPRDLDVVQAHKALHHAARWAADGAELVFAAACDEGWGSPAFARWVAAPDRATLETRARSHYDLNAQTAISLAAIAARVRVTWIAAQPLPELARWGVDVVPPAAATAVSAKALARARPGPCAWLPAAAAVLPADPPPSAGASL